VVVCISVCVKCRERKASRTQWHGEERDVILAVKRLEAVLILTHKTV
jgi:hypothetical protein